MYYAWLNPTFLATLTTDQEKRKAKVVFSGSGKDARARTGFRLDREEGRGVAGPILEITENSTRGIEDVVFEQMVKYNADIRAQMADMIGRNVIIVQKGAVAQTAANILALVAP